MALGFERSTLSSKLSALSSASSVLTEETVGGIILLAGISWDVWLSASSLFDLRAAFGETPAGIIA